MPDLVLSVSETTKRYATTVLDHVDFDLRVGEIHALLGSNGAGKSTLCKIIAGLTPPTSGSMKLANVDYAPASKQAAERRGVQIVQQELCLIQSLTVAENMMLSRLPTSFGVINRRVLRQHARVALDRLGLNQIDPDTPTSNLGIGQQQLVEIATALDRDCKALILDEPTSALSSSEAANLFDWLRRLRGQGIGIIYISHRLDEVAALSNRITVLRDGKRICTQETARIGAEEMVGLMTGESPSNHDATPFRSYKLPKIAFRADRLRRGAHVRDVSIVVHQGERLGIAGLVGAGRTEFLRLLFGADRSEAGEIHLGEDTTPQRFTHPSQAVAAGMAMVTEDRKGDGLLLPLAIRENATIGSLAARFSSHGLIRRRSESESVEQICDELEVRRNDIEQPVSTLSGGNQQKVAVAKWLVRGADIFLFDEPTRGIDIAARRRIYRLMESLAADRKAIVIVSSDLDELFETCDRIAVMSDGKMVATFERGSWSEDQIMQAAFAEHMGAPA